MERLHPENRRKRTGGRDQAMVMAQDPAVDQIMAMNQDMVQAMAMDMAMDMEKDMGKVTAAGTAAAGAEEVEVAGMAVISD